MGAALPSFVSDHLHRLRTTLLEGFSLAKVPEWICEKTTLEGLPYSFKDHEYQETILRDTSQEVVVKKCSQVGLTELSIRFSFAVMDILPDIHVIYTLPTSNFAKMVAKTRFDPIITSSSYLRERLNRTIDSTDTKQIGSSYLYIKGTIGQAAAISVPASLLVHDEVDFSDQGVLTNYQSRLTHSRYKLKRKLSTPTVKDYGIDAEFKQSRRFFNFCKCHHCAHWFLPDYFDHVKVPGFDGDLREITKENLHATRYHEARLLCPRCGDEPSLAPQNRKWVLENPSESHTAAGYQVSPFDAPAIITPSFLIESSTKYKRYADFINFNLGQTAEDKDNTLTREELEKLWYPGETPKFASYILGVDLGMLMHVTVAGVDRNDVMHEVELAQVPLSRWEEFYVNLCQRYRLSNGVFDSQPYSDLVKRAQDAHQRIYGAVYVTMKGMEEFVVVEKEEDPEENKLNLRMVKVNRNRSFDQYMADLRRGKILVSLNACEAQKENWLAHHTDMKRVQKFDKDDELFFNWEKSTKGNDHFHHSGLYCWIAKQMRGFGQSSTPFGHILTTFKNKSAR